MPVNLENAWSEAYEGNMAIRWTRPEPMNNDRLIAAGTHFAQPMVGRLASPAMVRPMSASSRIFCSC